MRRRKSSVIRRLFTAEEIRAYLDRLKRSKFLAVEDPDGEIDDLEGEAEEERWPDNPVVGAEELRRFSRVRQLQQESTEPPPRKI